MRNETIYGYSLIASVAGLVLVAMFHPTGHELRQPHVSVEHVAAVATAVHALALASVGLSWFALQGLSRWLGRDRPDVTLASIAFAMAVIGVIGAAVISGLVAPNVIKLMFDADELSRPALKQFLTYNWLLNQGFAKFHVMAQSVAIAAWSTALLRSGTGKGLGWLGWLISIATAGALILGLLRLNVHGLALVVLSHGAWFVWAGVLLVRSQVPSPAAAHA